MDWRTRTVARAHAVASVLPVLAVAVVVLTSATDFFPDTSMVAGIPVIEVLTPLRVIVGTGLVALRCSGFRLVDFRTSIDPAIGALVAVAAASTVLGHWPAAPLRELLVEIGVFYLAVGVRRANPESWSAVSMLALVAVSTAGAVAFAQVANQTPTGFCGGGFLGDVTCGNGAIIRADGTFSNPNELAAFQLLLAPLASCAVTLIDERLTRSVLIGLAALGGTAVLTTFSRGGYLAMVASAAVVAAARRLLPRLTRVQLTLLVTASALMLAACGGVIAVLWRHDASLGLRGTAWVAAVRVALAHPLWGVGLGRAGALVSASTGQQFAHVHNLWLNWLVDTGVPGLLAVTTITVAAMVRAARRAAQGSTVGTAELAGLTGFLVMSLLDDPANLSRIAMVMWLLIGLIMAETPVQSRHAPTRAHAAQSQRPRDNADLPIQEDPPTETTQPIPATPGGTAGHTRTAPADPLGETQPHPAVPRRPSPTTVPPPRRRTPAPPQQHTPRNPHR